MSIQYLVALAKEGAWVQSYPPFLRGVGLVGQHVGFLNLIRAIQKSRNGQIGEAVDDYVTYRYVYF